MIGLNLLPKRQCTKCRAHKPATRDFFYHHSRSASGLTYLCKQCLNDNNTKWKKEHPEETKAIKAEEYKKNKIRHLSTQMMTKYNISMKDRDEFLSKQGGCGICGRATPVSKGWHVDHDHSCCARNTSCGKCVRGILCAYCNSALGMFKDSKEILTLAIRYLEKYEAAKDVVDKRHPS